MKKQFPKANLKKHSRLSAITRRPLPVILISAVAASLSDVSVTHGAPITWGNTATNFNLGTSWSGGVAPGTGDIATFSTASPSFQPTLTADTSVLGLNFSATGTSNYSLPSTAFTLTLLSTSSTSAFAAITGLTTTGTNTISSKLNLGATLGSTQTFTQVGGGTLVLSGVISGAGSTNTLTLASTGNYTLSGTNTYTGITSQSAGSTITISNAAAFGTSTLSFGSSSGSITAGIALTGANKLTNAVIWGADETINNSGSFGIEFGGTVSLGGAARTIKSSISSGATFSNVISNDAGGGLAIVTANSSLVSLSGTNTYTGNTTISGTGKVSVAAIGNASSSGNLGAGTTINLGATTAVGSLLYTGTGETTTKVLNLSGTTGGVTIDQSGATGLLKFSSDLTATGAGLKTLTLQGSTAGTGEIAGKIVDSTSATSLTKSGTSTWSLSGANTYTGATTISSGTLAVSGSLANTAVSLATGTTLALSNSASIGGSVALTNGASTTLSLSSNTSIGGLSGGGTTGGTVALAANSLTLNQAGATSYTGAITGTGKLIKSGAGTLTLNRTSSYGTGFVLRVNQGIVELNRGSSALSGILDSGATVELGGGTLQLTASSGGNFALPLGALDIYANSTFALSRTSSSNQTVNENIPLNFRSDSTLNITFNLIAGGVTTFTGAANTLYANGGLTFDTTGLTSAVALSNAIGESGGSFSFSKGGTGTLTLSAANTFTGAYNANGGTTSLASDNALGSVSSVVVANGSLVQSSITGFTDEINDAASVTLNGTGTLDMSGGNETVASIASSSGTSNLVIGKYGTGAISGSFTVGDTTSTSFAGVIKDGGTGTGTTTFTKQGTGTLTLSGLNTFTGTSNINAGTIGIGVSNVATTSGALGTSANVVNLGNTTGTAADASLLTTGAFTFSNAITVRSGNAGIATIGGSTAAISTFSGAIGLSKDLTVTAINGGAVNLTKSIANTSGTNTVNITGGGTSNIVLNNATVNQFAPTAFSVNSGKLTLGASNQIADATSVAVVGGTFDLGTFSDTVGAVTISSGTISGSGTLTGSSYSLTNSGAISAVLAGSGVALTKSGMGTVTLSGVNTYNGGTTLSNGTLALGASSTVTSGTVSSGPVGTGTLTLIGGTLRSTAATTGGDRTINNNLSLGGSIALGDATSTGVLTFDNSILTTRSAVLTADTALITNSAVSIVDALSGAGINLSKAGTGALNLGGVNTFSGSFAATGGVTNLNVNGALGSVTAVSIGTGATVQAGVRSLTNAINDAASVILNGTGILNVSGGTETIGSLSATLGGPSVVIGSYTDAGSVVTAGSLTVGNASDTLFAGVISGSTATAGQTILTKQGTGILTLAGANTFTDVLAITAGGITLTNNAGLGASGANNGTTVASGAVLRLDGTTAAGILAIGAEPLTLSGTGLAAAPAGALRNIGGANSFAGAITLGSASTITATAGTLTLTGGINNGGFLATFDGAGNTVVSTNNITGGGGLAKTGTGTLTLSAANDYTGGTTVSAGTLAVNTGGTIGASTGALAVNAATGVTSALNLNVSQTVGSLSGTVASTGTATINLATGTVLTSSQTGNSQYAGTLAGGGGLTKAGIGTLTLTGSSSYTGATVVGGGTLELNATSGPALNRTVSVTVNNGGTLLMDRSAQVNGAGIILSGGTLTIAGNGNTQSFGALTLSASSVSVIDFGTGTGTNSLTFASLNGMDLDSSTLKVYNWSGNGTIGGGTDQLYFTNYTMGITQDELNNIMFYSDAGTTQIGDGSSYRTNILGSNEFVPVPEPGTVAAGLLALGTLGYSQRRRVREFLTARRRTGLAVAA